MKFKTKEAKFNKNLENDELVVNIISDKMNPTTTITGTKHPRKPREMTK
jgi:hypothetical protein